MKYRYLFAAIIFLFSASGFQAQQKQEQGGKQPPTPASQATPTAAVSHVFTISSEDAARKNPLRFSEISVQRGKKLYETQCSMCHGEKGDGKGDMVEEMKIHPPDFTKSETLARRTDGELFTIIQLGSSDMPGQGKRMNDTYKWEIVNYLRSLGGKAALKSTEEELQEGTVAVQDKDKSRDKDKKKN